jgi:hypothetical protein
MASFKKIQDLAHTAILVARKASSDLDSVHKGIYDLAMHALMSEVLTLRRMTKVVESVRKGIEDISDRASIADDSGKAKSQREACRGLCTAASEGLTAAGLGYVAMRKFSDNSLSVEFYNALLKVVLDYKRQLDQINMVANWSSDSRIMRLQMYWFDQLLHIEKQDLKQENMSAIPWSHVFFQSCGYEEKIAKNDVESNLMLLGLLTSGALVGLLADQTIA